MEHSNTKPLRDCRPPGKSLTNSLWEPHESIVSVPPQPLPSKNLLDLFLEHAETFPERIFATQRDPDDNLWLTTSWEETATLVKTLAFHLAENYGVQKGDRVAILSYTRFEWVVADLATLSLGAVSTPIYQSALTDEVGYVLWDSQARVIFAENQEQVDKLEELMAHGVTIPPVEGFAGGHVKLDIGAVITFEAASSKSVTNLTQFAELLCASVPDSWSAQYLRLRSATSRSDLASIVYTSGTTGPSKGVMQTHGNHLAMLEGVLASGLLGSGSGIFLFLPLAHSFARLVAYAAVGAGGDLIFPTVTDRKASRFNARQIFQDVAESRPVVFPSVPRMFEKIMSNLTNPTGGSTMTRLISRLIAHYRRILALAKTPNHGLATVYEQILRPLIRIVMGRIFGNRLRYCISGGAPISMEVLSFFDSLGVLILEGYGLTETTPALCANTKDFCRFGTVGRPFAGVELRIAESDGEILARGGNVAIGYWRRTEETKKAWSADGWFSTGDIGYIDADGFLSITDRKKDLIVTAGKNIAPALVEGRLKSSPYISQALVYGDRKPYLVALITLELDNVRAALQIPQFTPSQVAEDARTRDLIRNEIRNVNSDLPSYEQVKHFAILNEDFSVENGLLSPSMKLKRKAATEQYRTLIESLYAKSSGQD